MVTALPLPEVIDSTRFELVRVATDLWPNAKESFRDGMMSALAFMLSRPLPSLTLSGGFSPVIGDQIK